MGRAGSKRVVLTTMFNIRDLGGYASACGQSKFHRFLRSGDTMFLSDEERSFLLDYGIARVVDLRMAVERPELSNRFAQLDGVAWINSSMADDRTMTPDWMASKSVVSFVIEGYQRMLADKDGVRRIFSFMAKAAPGECVLFHCAGGMDRTGVVSMLILGATGVSQADIVADYAYSFDEDEKVDEMLAAWKPSDPEPEHDGTLARIFAMNRLYEAIIEQHGSVRGLLLDCGVTEAEIDALVSHLVDEQ